MLRPRVITHAYVDSRRLGQPGDRSPGGARETMPPDAAISKVIKYIPAEIIALQQVLNGWAVAAPTDGWLIGWLSIVLLVLTPVWFAVSTREKGDPISWPQVVLSTIAFAFWLYAVSEPAKAHLPNFGLSSVSGSFIFALFLLATPMLEKLLPPWNLRTPTVRSA